MTIQNLMQHCGKQLQSIYEKEEADAITRLLMVKTFEIEQLNQTENKIIPVNSNTFKEVQQKMKVLLLGKPIQYVLEEAWFYKFPFFVNEAVLIPRAETEELVFTVLQYIKEQNLNQPKILEIGTGSGCIAISIKKECPNARITALDVSTSALAVAEKNATVLGAGVNFFQMDFLDEMQWEKLSDAYDLIISNPPYIPPEQKSVMHKNVLDYEPHLALFVTAEDPLIFYKKIALFQQKQKKKPIIFCEINEALGGETLAVFLQNGCLKVNLKKDMQHKDRILIAQ